MSDDQRDLYHQQLLEEQEMMEIKEKDFFNQEDPAEEVEISTDFFSLPPSHSNLFTALSKAQGEIEAVDLERENPYYQSKYADIHDVGQALKNPLKNNGLFFTQMWLKGECKAELQVRTLIGHESGEYMTYISSLWVKTPEDIQSVGKAKTYARRYILSSAFGVTGTERQADDDGSTASLPEESNAELLNNLREASKKGYASAKAKWEKMSVAERTKISPKDREKVIAEAKAIDKRKVKEVNNGTKKPGVVRSAAAQGDSQ